MINVFSNACDESNLNAIDTDCFSSQKVQDVSIGAKVLTLDATGTLKLTTATANEGIPGRVEGQELRVDVEDDTRYLTVTSGHVVLVYPAGSKEPHLALADRVQVGDWMSCNGRFGFVSSNNKVELAHRNALATADGTVLANGLLVSTICEEYGSGMTTPHGGAFAVLQQWQVNHSAVLAGHFTTGKADDQSVSCVYKRCNATQHPWMQEMPRNSETWTNSIQAFVRCGGWCPGCSLAQASERD